MFGKRLCIAVLTVVTMLTASAVAQDERTKSAAPSAAPSSATRESPTRRISTDHLITAKG